VTGGSCCELIFMEVHIYMKYMALVDLGLFPLMMVLVGSGCELALGLVNKRALTLVAHAASGGPNKAEAGRQLTWVSRLTTTVLYNRLQGLGLQDYGTRDQLILPCVHAPARDTQRAATQRPHILHLIGVPCAVRARSAGHQHIPQYRRTEQDAVARLREEPQGQGETHGDSHCVRSHLRRGATATERLRLQQHALRKRRHQDSRHAQSLAMLQFLRRPENRAHCPYSALTCGTAAAVGHLEVLQWLRWPEDPCAWLGKEVQRAAKGGHQAVLEWLRVRGREVHLVGCRGAAQGKQLELLKWMRSSTSGSAPPRLVDLG